MFVRPTQGVETFGNIFSPFCTLAILQNFTEIVTGEPLRRGIKRKRGNRAMVGWTYLRVYLCHVRHVKLTRRWVSCHLQIFMSTPWPSLQGGTIHGRHGPKLRNHLDWAHNILDHALISFHYLGLFNPFNASCSKVLLFEGFSTILV